MGLEFALVHDETKEAFELGKWCGWEWRSETTVPATRDAVLAYFRVFYADEDHPDEPSDPLIEPMTDAVWSFIEGHPGCRVVDEHDYYWKKEPTDDDRRIFGAEYVFREVGSRYDVVPAQHKGDEHG